MSKESEDNEHMLENLGILGDNSEGWEIRQKRFQREKTR